MVDRTEFAHPQSYQQRKNLYLKHVRYWNHILLEERIDVFLALNVPHEMFDFVLYSLCKLYGIPTVIGYQTQVSDTILTMSDWERSADGLAERHGELRRKYRSVAEDAIELTGRFRRDYEKQTLAQKPTPFYMNAAPPAPPSLLARARGLAKLVADNRAKLPGRLLEADFWVERSRQLYETRRRAKEDRELLAAYDALAVEPNLERKYIYLALHYQPEMTTCPLGGVFVEQVLIAQLIAATLPDDVHLYIKEHPMQKRIVGRYAGYYDELHALPRTTLVPKSFDTYRLIDRAAAVATATGTVGWEALYREKPILLFGHNFYQYATGVFAVHSAEDCRAAMTRIFGEGFRPTRKDLKIFLKALEETSVEGYLTTEYGNVAQLSPEENQENVFRLLRDGIRTALTDRSKARVVSEN